MRVSSIEDSRFKADSPRRIEEGEDRAMRAAIRLARRGFGTTHPNPRVGAVLLREGGIVGEGFHARAGEAHAEARALAAAGSRARGSTLVATLEPCAHHGRTPPCADAIVSAGVRRVVLGMRDPNPLVNGRGVARLRAAGIEVVEDVRGAECRELNRPYLKHLATGLPWVMLKSMISLDGRVAADSGDSRGLGGGSEQRLCHRLRAEHDAVLVGIGTVLADDPELTVRLVRGRSPVRVVLDTDLRTPAGSRLVMTAGSVPLAVATASEDRARIEALERRGVSIWRFARSPEGRVPIRRVLSRLAAEGRLSILVEGGPTVHSAFLSEGLADRVAIGIAPLILGGSKTPGWTRDLGRKGVGDAIEVGPLVMRRVGRDLWVEGALGASEAGRV
ncbi:MAG: bifunctional diaminohydroxyphosphoribosylaminopyrimidine deaminase/5-amino-6-(5-phosphoribosylamino)uracil reductase RibD [Candidatus Latescibacteria bacterium]|nr:bifunctional diaminohydroxyphosphoribosylaminopyrimidine deaminase/5-amino-6-(5-phosphoribosylamino)uracil reductase RibD [Candidatus Latescibacterota bacterium]